MSPSIRYSSTWQSAIPFRFRMRDRITVRASQRCNAQVVCTALMHRRMHRRRAQFVHLSELSCISENAAGGTRFAILRASPNGRACKQDRSALAPAHVVAVKKPTVVPPPRPWAFPCLGRNSTMARAGGKSTAPSVLFHTERSNRVLYRLRGKAAIEPVARFAPWLSTARACRVNTSPFSKAGSACSSPN